MKKHNIYNFEKQLDSAIKNLARSNISKRNKKIIMNFHDSCFAEELSVPRIIKYVSTLKNISKIMKKDFDKADKKDIMKLMQIIERRDYSDWTKKDYKVTLKKFYKWIRGTEEYPEEVKWFETNFKNNNHKLPEELLTEQDIKSLIESAENTRDKALISVLYESGCRVGKREGKIRQAYE